MRLSQCHGARSSQQPDWAKHVSLVSIESHVYSSTTHMYILTWLATKISKDRSTHTNTGSTDSFCVSTSNRSGWRSVGGQFIHRAWMPVYTLHGPCIAWFPSFLVHINTRCWLVWPPNFAVSPAAGLVTCILSDHSVLYSCPTPQVHSAASPGGG